MTLVRSNPAFKVARNAMLRDEFAPHVDGCAFYEAQRAQDRLADQVAEESGSDLGFSERLLHTLAALDVTVDPADPRIGIARDRQRDLAHELRAARPFHQELPAQLAALVSTLPVAVVSNTGYLPGSLMRDLLTESGFPDFASYSFSDEVGASKPSPTIFDHALTGLRRVLPDLQAADVLHVGDNPRADVAGATAFGMRAALVNVDCHRSIAELIDAHLLTGGAR